jgi:hypothetical protein
LLALVYMMMVCPKCGFSQPSDRFCAQCGVDVSVFHVKPKPWIVRFVQNPNLHLFLIGCLVVVVLGYIFYTQRALLGNEVNEFLNDIPLLSKDSSDGGAAVAASSKPPPPAAAASASRTEALAAPAEQNTNGFLPDEGASALPEGDESKTASAESTGSGEFEVSFWAVGRDVLNQLVPTADKANDGGEGRIMVWQQSSKVLPAIEGSGQQLEGGGSVSLATSPMTVTDGADGSPLQFTSKITMSKAAGVGNEFNLKLEIDWHLPSAEVGRYVDASIDGTATIPFKGAIMVIIDPAERTVRGDLLKSVNGPMSIFASEEFRSGVTDWVMLVHQK